MARIVGVDLPRNKRGEIALTYIYGIGKSTAQSVLDEAGVDRNAKVEESGMTSRLITSVAF